MALETGLRLPQVLIRMSNTESISVALGTTTSVESQVTGGSSSQVCITPPRYKNEPYNRAREKPPVLTSTSSPPPTTAPSLSTQSIPSSITPGPQLSAQVIRIADQNNIGDMILDSNYMRSPEISRTNEEIKYKMIRSSKHVKRSKLKKSK